MRAVRLAFPPLLLLALAAPLRAQQLDPHDPVVLRLRLLQRLDAEIDAGATAAHFRVRYALDDLMPIAYLGIDADPEDGGMKVTKVYPVTGAAEAGVRKDDLIVAFNGVKTPSAAALGRVIRAGRVGDRAEFRVVRDGKELTLTAKLGPRPEEDEDEDEQFPELPGAKKPVARPARLSFDRADSGSTPKAIEAVLSGHGRPGRWIVVAEGDAAWLRQAEGDRTGIRFPLALVRDFDSDDAIVKVRFRYAGGEQDRCAGIVLRYRGPGNYLVARVNATEKDLRIFRVVNGVRRTLPGARAETPAGDDEWHTLEFRAEGAKLTAVLDGEVSTTSYDTFLRRGRVGLWTKSDSVTDFDDLDVALPAK